MKEYILGIPKGKEKIVENILPFTSIQDCAHACSHAVGITTDSLEKAKEKYAALLERNFEPLTHQA